MSYILESYFRMQSCSEILKKLACFSGELFSRYPMPWWLYYAYKLFIYEDPRDGNFTPI